MRGGLNGLNNGRVGEIRFINQFWIMFPQIFFIII
jgi:hypothetical protein